LYRSRGPTPARARCGARRLAVLARAAGASCCAGGARLLHGAGAPPRPWLKAAARSHQGAQRRGRCRARMRETAAVGGGAPTAVNEDSLSPPAPRGPQALLPALVLARTAGASQNSNPGFSHQRSFSVVKLSNAKIIATITKREITLGSLQP